jgi:dihydropyrimidinase
MFWRPAMQARQPRSVDPPSQPPVGSSAAPFDLLIRGGLMVTAEGRRPATIAVRGSTIAEIGPPDAPWTATVELDARALVVLPGGIDPHVHLTCSDATEADPGWIDDFESGSAAALAGGITALGNMTFVLPDETVTARVEREAAEARSLAIADIFLHPVLLSPTDARIAELPGLAASGSTSLKFFMSFPSFEKDAGQFGLAMHTAANSNMITMIHCEDQATIQCCTTVLTALGHRSFQHFPASRPPSSEVVATERAIAMCEVTGAPTYIVHLSSARALAACMEARARGLPIFVETRPIYLHFTSERYSSSEGALFVTQPPVREAADRAALWAGLASGAIDTMGSDHAPWTRLAKLHASHDLANLRPGVADLDTMLPMLMTEGVVGGRLSLERFVQVTSTNAARLFGLYPQKGTIAVGSDADLVLWDMHANRTLRDADLKTRARHTVYEGFELRAVPRTTIRRGEIVFHQGQVLGRPGSGRILHRGPTTRPLRPAG